MKKLFLLAAMALLPLCAKAQDEKTESLDSTVVTAFRAGTRTPVAHTDLSKKELHSASTLSSLPMALSLQPSVVSMNEGGTGLGYSKMRLRGSDPTRINVTINGITRNDAESQEVFWVNIPGLSGMLNSVQLQRGIGTSVNGPGAFGGSINMQTALPQGQPYGEVELSSGSYRTAIVSAAAGSGRLANGLSLDLRYSYNQTEGYLDNAWARLHSLFGGVSYLHGNNSLKLNYILGVQHSGITWEGCPPEMLETNRRYNPTVCKGQIDGYQGDSDNYIQQHVQGVFTHQFSPNLVWTTTLHYTDGVGYYENYKSKNKETGVKGDFWLEQAMDNGYWASNTALKWSAPRLTAIADLAYSYYNGDHFGFYKNADGTQDPSYYLNNGKKHDLATFLRGEWRPAERLNIYADLQYRHIAQVITGDDKDHVSLAFDRDYDFFNPKGGFSWQLTRSGSLYASVAMGHREPSRSDIKESIKSGREDEIRPERMLDYEFGYNYAGTRFALGANVYLMEYKDQLLATGLLSETGYAIKQNVPRSYRRGIELTAGAQVFSWLRAEGNLTLSTNKILDYTNYVDLYDNSTDWNFVGQQKEHFDKTDILLSPRAIGMAALTFTPLKALEIKLSWKYVGKQYWDNTASEERMLKAYDIFALQAHYALTDNVKMSIFVDNLLSRKYEADAWVYRAVFQNGDTYTEAGLFPQAPCNAIFKLTVTF